MYFKSHGTTFPDTAEEFGHFVGFSEHVGHAMTYKIWNKRTNKIVDRSAVRSARNLQHSNKRAQPFALLQPQLPHSSPDQSNGERSSSALDKTTAPSGRPPGFHNNNPNPVIYSKSKHPSAAADTEYGEPAYLSEDGSDSRIPSVLPPTDDSDISPTPILRQEDGTYKVVLLDDDGNPKVDSNGNYIYIDGINPADLQGRTFKKRLDDGRLLLRARIVDSIDTLEDQQNTNKALVQFKIKYDRDDVEDIMTYNDVMNYIHRDTLEEEGQLWKFRDILSHRGPLTHRDHNYMGSKYNVIVEWENGEQTEEPLTMMIKDDPVTMALYARKNNLLETEGWKRLRRIAKRDKQLTRLINQVKLRSFRTAPKFKYGFQIPRNYEEAVLFDQRNGNTRWQDATDLELKQLNDYCVFIDKGEYHVDKIPPGFKKIKVHLIYDCKHDGRHKARMVADGHLTELPLNSVYAGVVSLRGLRICIFLAELNGMEAWATDIGNAYLEATTQEKVCIRAGKEFGDQAGNLLIIHKALYGLRSSGKEFGDLLAECLKQLGFTPSKAEPQIFMREKDGQWEWIGTYVDDLCLVMKDPQAFLTELQSEPFNFKLKGSGPMNFHLGCGFGRDPDGTLYMDPRIFIEKMIDTYVGLYGEKPSTKAQSPLEEGDHPELDSSEFLEEIGIQQYQSLVGSLQWAITIGRWDVQTAVMTLSGFRSQPRKGHLERIKRVCGYVRKFIDFKIRFRVDEPDMSAFNTTNGIDWSKTVYGEHGEEIPHDAPKPLGKSVTLIHFFDANLMHDVLSGKAVTGCLHFANKTPIMWYSKKQATSETATYGAEFSAARTCIEQVVDLRQTFRYLGVPINNISYVFGDNKSMIDSAKFPYSRLNKRHNILSFHYVRSMIAKKFIAINHINSQDNVSDILSKHWSHNAVYHLLKPLFHHIGDTGLLYIDDSPGCLDHVIRRLPKEK